MGGTCLNIGCIPTKALTTATELLLRARRAGDFGVTIPTAGVDLPKMMAYKQETVDGLVSGVEFLLRERKVTLLRGTARLVRPDTVQVTAASGAISEIEADQVVLAPGSVTARPPIAGLALPGVITSTEASNITDVPARLVVIGGGVIGLEFACIDESHRQAWKCSTILWIVPALPAESGGFAIQRIAVQAGIAARRDR